MTEQLPPVGADRPADADALGAQRRPPESGDPVIDEALAELAAVPADDLDAQLAAGEAVHRTLQARLHDLGG